MFGKKLIAASVASVVGITVAMNSYTIVSEGKEKAGATFGKVHEQAYESGFHIVNPLADFFEYDLQEMTYSWEDVGVPAQDNLKTNMDVHVTGRFIAGKAPIIRDSIGSQSQFMNSQVTKRVRAIVIEVGKEKAERSQAFFGENMLSVMEDEIVSRLNSELNDRGYEITAVKFSDIRLPQVVTNAIVKTKEANQKVNTQQALLDIQQKKAQEVVNTAAANAEAAKQDRIARQEAADAKLYEMQQEAAGNKALAESVTVELIQLKQAEAALLWDGKMPQTMLGESSNVLMSLAK